LNGSRKAIDSAFSDMTKLGSLYVGFRSTGNLVILSPGAERMLTVKCQRFAAHRGTDEQSTLGGVRMD
jgi:hypothetical protein